MALLEVSQLAVSFEEARSGLRSQVVRVMEDVELSVDAGEIVAVVGASGSGKSLLAHAIMGILPDHARVTGEIRYQGELLDERRLAQLRGSDLAFIPQSVSYLDPLMRVGQQVRGAKATTERVDRQQAIFRRYELSDEVEQLYPFQLSGGMSRKVLVSSATIGGARLLIADEPTPGMHPLDVEEALKQLRELAEEGCGVLLITHDISAALTIADRVAIINEGTTVEVAQARDFDGDGSKLRHPYSRALWRALPENGFELLPGAQPASCIESTSVAEQQGGSNVSRLNDGTMRVEGVDLGYQHERDNWLFRNVNIDVASGEIVGLVGRSGTGKTTLAKLLAGYLEASEGTAQVEGDVAQSSGRPSSVQLVFQHPEQAVNPRWTIKKILQEGWNPDDTFLEAFGVRRDWLRRLPRELSGGELQRVCIVRALGPATRFLIADEMTTMLDPITQAQIWHSVLAIVKSRNIGLLIISHDHALLHQLCDRIVDINGNTL